MKKIIILLIFTLSFALIAKKKKEEVKYKDKKVEAIVEKLKYLQDNYKDALIVEDTTRIYKVYYENFKDFEKMCGYFDRNVKRAGVKFFELRKYYKMYWEEFKYAREKNKKKEWSRKNKNKSTYDMSYALKKINQHISLLNKMEYPNIKWENPKRDQFQYFETLFKKYDKTMEEYLSRLRKIIKEGNFDTRLAKIMKSERFQDFDNETLEMKVIGKKIEEYTKANKIIKLTLKEDTNSLRNIFHDLEDIIKEEQKEIIRLKKIKQKYKNRKTKPDENPQLIEKRFCVKAIQSQINSLKKKKFKLINEREKSIGIPPILEKKKENTSTDSKEKTEEIEQVHEILTEAPTSQNIKGERENIISAEGSHKEITDKYLKTLNKEENEEFIKLKTKFLKKGYGEDMSGFWAIRTLHDK